MPTPPLATQTGGLLSGAALTDYFEAFSSQFLGGPQPSAGQPHTKDSKCGPDLEDGWRKEETPKAHFLMRTEVLDIRREAVGDWRVTVRDVPLSDSSSSDTGHDEENRRNKGEERVLRFARIVLASGVRLFPSLDTLFQLYN